MRSVPPAIAGWVEASAESNMLFAHLNIGRFQTSQFRFFGFKSIFAGLPKIYVNPAKRECLQFKAVSKLLQDLHKLLIFSEIRFR